MRRMCLILGFLCASGCVSESGTGFFDEALKDLRGDNQQMRTGNFSELPASSLSSNRK